jgi:TolB protein
MSTLSNFRQSPVMNVDGSDPQRLTTLGEAAYHPRWFPDGNRLIFTTHRDTYIVNADGSGLTKMPYDCEPAPAISPDGKKLAGTFPQMEPYQGGVAFVTSDLIVSDIDGSNRVSLTGCSKDKLCTFWGTTWSPDGRWIAFGVGSADFTPKGHGIYVIRADGSNMKRLTFMENAIAPSWSPDGRKIAFISMPPGPEAELYVMNSDGSNISKVPFALAPAGTPTWSPDSTKLAVEDTSNTIYIINADGSQPVAISPGHEPTWQPRP